MRCRNCLEVIVVPNNPVQYLFQAASGARLIGEDGIEFLLETEEKVIEVAKRLSKCLDVPYDSYALEGKTIVLCFRSANLREDLFVQNSGPKK